jgi:hypothetical protein
MSAAGRSGRVARPRAAVVTATVVALLCGGALVACTPAGGDIEATRAGGNLGGPFGDVRIAFLNVGDEVLSGPTTVVAEVTAGQARFTHAAVVCSYCGPGVTPPAWLGGVQISPDGRRLEARIDGTIPSEAGRHLELRVSYNGLDWRQPGSFQVAFTHPDDVNPANDTVTYAWPGV